MIERPAKNPRPAPPAPSDLPADTCIRRVSSGGTIGLNRVIYMVDAQRRFEQVLVIRNGDKIIVTDTHGEILVEHTRPAPGIKYVGNGRRRGPRPRIGEVSPLS